MTVDSNSIKVGISDAKLSADPDSVLVTHALGSCIGVTVYDPVKKIGGMLHFQLPKSPTQDHTAEPSPFKYADTGFEALLEALLSSGAVKRRLQVKLAGGAMRIEAKTDAFDIGNKNHLAIRKILWAKGLLIKDQDIGGTIPRTMYLNLSDGKVTIKSAGKVIKEM